MQCIPRSSVFVQCTTCMSALVPTSFILPCAVVSTQRTITFDDLPTTDENGNAIEFGNVPNGYQGFDWDLTAYINGPIYTPSPSGYQAGVVSSPNVALNAGGTASISRLTPFSMISLNTNAAWNIGQTNIFTGFLRDMQVAQVTAVVDDQATTLVQLNFNNVDLVTFEGSGGTQDPAAPASGTFVVIDNILVDDVPNAA